MDLSVSGIAANLLVSAVGCGIFLYGKKQRRAPQLLAGLLLMTYPYFVDGATAMLTIGACIVGALWLALRAGV